MRTASYTVTLCNVHRAMLASIQLAGLNASMNWAHSRISLKTAIHRMIIISHASWRYGCVQACLCWENQYVAETRKTYDPFLAIRVDPGQKLSMCMCMDMCHPASSVSVFIFILLLTRGSAGKHNITAIIEEIKASEIGSAYERMLKSDVRYRFVIDVQGSLIQ